MKLKLLMEDFVQEINSRERNNKGKIEVTDEEFETLFNYTYGYEEEEKPMSIDEYKQWAKDTREFGEIYEIID